MRLQFYPTKEPSKMKKTALRASALALFVAMAAGCATTGLDDVKATADRAAADAAAAASAAEAARAAADRAAQAASSAQSTADQALAAATESRLAAKQTKKAWNVCSRSRCPSKDQDKNRFIQTPRLSRRFLCLRQRLQGYRRTAPPVLPHDPSQAARRVLTSRQ